LSHLDEPGEDQTLEELGVDNLNYLPELTDFRISKAGDFFLNGALGGVLCSFRHDSLVTIFSF
jgi:hypothetical protein